MLLGECVGEDTGRGRNSETAADQRRGGYMAVNIKRLQKGRR